VVVGMVCKGGEREMKGFPDGCDDCMIRILGYEDKNKGIYCKEERCINHPKFKRLMKKRMEKNE